MKIMMMDTSTALLFVCFLDNGKEIYRATHVGKNNHSDYLLETIQTGLKETNLEVKDFDRILVGLGPGAYTGLRVSLTVAKMFSWTLNIPLYTFSSLDFLASGYLKKDGIYPIMTRAKKGHVYGKVLEVRNGVVSTVVKEQFKEVETFQKNLEAFQYSVLITEEEALIDPVVILEQLATKTEELVSLEPNYLRGEL